MEWPDHFDFVLVTVPIGHLKRFAPAMFTPPLPRDKLEMFDAIGFGAMQKVDQIMIRLSHGKKVLIPRTTQSDEQTDQSSNLISKSLLFVD